MDSTHGTGVPRSAQSRLLVSEADLVDWGMRFGRAVTPPLVVALSGDLGAGKTTLTKAICRGYGVADDVTSPTFTCVHQYSGGPSLTYHLDLFRLRHAGELAALGWDEIMDSEALVIVEWPERAEGRLPAGHVSITLEHVSSDPTRRILYAGGHV